MYKKLLSLALAMALCIGMAIPTLAADISVVVNGETVQWTGAQPFIDENSRTLVPLSAVAQVLGLTVAWDGETRTATFSKEYTLETSFDVDETEYCSFVSVAFTIDHNDYEFFSRYAANATAETTKSGGGYIDMDTAAIIRNDRTYAPLKYLAESFGYSVGWNGETRTITVGEGGASETTPPASAKTISCTGQAMTWDGSELDYSGAKGGDFFDLENDYAKASVSIISATEAVFTLEVPFPLTEAWDYDIGFIQEDSGKFSSYSFQYFRQGMVYETGLELEEEIYSLNQSYWETDNPDAYRYDQIAGVSFTELEKDMAGGKLVFRVALPSDCPFTFDMAENYEMYCGVLAMYGG